MEEEQKKWSEEDRKAVKRILPPLEEEEEEEELKKKNQDPGLTIPAIIRPITYQRHVLDSLEANKDAYRHA